MAEKILKVVVVGDAKKAEAALGRVGNAAKKMGDTGKKLTRNLTMPILGAGAALVALGVKAGQNADRLLDMEAQTGIATDTLQEYEFVAGQAGVSTDFFRKSATEVIKAMDQLEKGTGPISEAYDALGINIRDTNGEMKSAEQLTTEAMEALAAIEDPTKRAALAEDIFKRSHLDMLPVLDQGIDAINEQREAAHKLGAVQSKEALQGANKFRMGMEKLKSGLGGVVGTLGSELAPLLSDVVLPLIQNSIVPVIRSFAQLVGGLAKRFKSLPGPLRGVIGGVIGLAAAMGPLLIVTSKVTTLFAADGNLVKGFGHVKKGFLKLTKTLMANPWILLIAAVVALVVIIVKNWDKITAFLSETWEKITAAVAAVGDWFVARWNDIVDFFTGIPARIATAAAGMWDGIKDAVAGVKDWFVEKWDQIIDFLTGIPRKISDAASGMWDGIKNAFRAAINWLIRKWNNFELKLGGQTISLGPLGEINIPSVTLRTPNIPEFHGGGVFRAPTRGGEGLAILKDRERVTAGDHPATSGVTIQLNVSGVGTEIEELTRMLTDQIAWKLRTVGV